jgi:hypothetical protein
MMNGYQRTGDLIDLDKIRHMKIVYAGAGSLISFTASGLLYPFGQQIFADPGVMKDANLERHWIDTQDQIGVPKVIALKNRITTATKGKIDPKSIIAHQAPIERIFDSMVDANLIIVGIDDEIAKGDINQFCVLHNIPAIYGGLSAKGVSGTVISIPTPREVCYRCAQHALGKDVNQGQGDGNYGFDITDRRSQNNLVAEPALKVSVQILGADMALMVQRLLGIRKGGDVIVPNILYETIDWDSVLTIGPAHPVLGILANFIASFGQMGLVQTEKIKFDGHNYQYMCNFQRRAVKLTRWSRCPLHNISRTSTDDI